ncbi:expressed unknown protein [Seminavis robusta]|uniref:Uncharacterized protein n=1 Tax=Seminavis robusta TaxID=568900 RepID=A0A9N8H4K8_9STRA|nr:expressed unknown protein [Seminavis robusta]|eukprot:Sro65_g036980.1 n/a (127) ;mRNA; r:125987-126367
MLTATATTPISASSNSNPETSDSEVITLKKAILDLDNMVAPLRTKTQKKLDKIEEEITNCNFLIDSGLGSKKDQAELKKTKRQLRNRRVKLWDELKALPDLEGERKELQIQLKDLRRRYGILDEEM